MARTASSMANSAPNRRSSHSAHLPTESGTLLLISHKNQDPSPQSSQCPAPLPRARTRLRSLSTLSSLSSTGSLRADMVDCDTIRSDSPTGTSASSLTVADPLRPERRKSARTRKTRSPLHYLSPPPSAPERATTSLQTPEAPPEHAIPPIHTNPARVTGVRTRKTAAETRYRPFGPRHLEYDYHTAHQAYKEAIYLALVHIGYNQPPARAPRPHAHAHADGEGESAGLAARLKRVPSVRAAARQLDAVDGALEAALARGERWDNTPVPRERRWENLRGSHDANVRAMWESMEAQRLVDLAEAREGLGAQEVGGHGLGVAQVPSRERRAGKRAGKAKAKVGETEFAVGTPTSAVQPPKRGRGRPRKSLPVIIPALPDDGAEIDACMALGAEGSGASGNKRKAPSDGVRNGAGVAAGGHVSESGDGQRKRRG